MGIIERIQALCAANDAVILAHNYCNPEVQQVAGQFGDSLELAVAARGISQRNIVLCGVRFMAETAAILNPDRVVLTPEMGAGCPMADMAAVEAVAAMRERYPDAVFVSYVNTSVGIKALSDICCTSSNALRIVNSVPPDRQIVFLPDQNLGSWIMEQTGRDMVLWPGFCPSHQRIRPQHLQAARDAAPDAIVMVHPECQPAVRAMADHVLGTKAMLDYCAVSRVRRFIVGTERGLLHRLRVQNPDAEFFGLEPEVVCANMKKTTLESVLWCLESISAGDTSPYRVTVDPATAALAIVALRRMVDVSTAPA